MTASMALSALTSPPPNVGAGAPSLDAGYGVSLTDTAAFENSMAKAGSGAGLTVQPAPIKMPGETLQALFRPLEQINTDSSKISAQAKAAMDEGRSLTPGEMVTLTVQCHEFMFHCQLTSNIANRTSDGLQQLFRQQS
jgi:hypothetical protein